MASAIVTINATLKVSISPAGHGEADRLAQRLIERLGREGEIMTMDYSVLPVGKTGEGVTIPIDRLRAAVSSVQFEKTPNAKGRALENLLVDLFRTIPGFAVKSNLHTHTEEIDLWITNGSTDPRLQREAAVIIAECKNWMSKCGKNDFVVFKEKMLNRSGRCSLGFLISWNGFAETITKEMLRGSREEWLIVPLEGDHIKKAVELGGFLPEVIRAWDAAVSC